MLESVIAASDVDAGVTGSQPAALPDQLARGPHAAFYDASADNGGGSTVNESCSWRVFSARDIQWGPEAENQECLNEEESGVQFLE
ncbi:uncharacterized protein A4U43_C04F25900 [Asparagus officinalis]|uniref:Uncharacterized protein n=1 Tax=Asparagus officinalis TaxID=4686 RepID=A0A5P1F4E7_ASPOF|nr:uncharacterized protein A4U43_C04F25900 [Asparagus officinalis]